MKHQLLYPFGFFFGMAFLISCNGDQPSAQMSEAEKETIETMDSLSTDLDQTIETLNTKTTELDREIDEILEDLD